MQHSWAQFLQVLSSMFENYESLNQLKSLRLFELQMHVLHCRDQRMHDETNHGL